MASSSGGELRDREYQDCCANLLLIRDAINAYRRAHHDLPAKLADLHPEFLKNDEKLICPIAARKGDTSVGTTSETLQKQHDTLTSYSYEFSKLGRLEHAPDRTMREFKEAQMAKVGSRVPIVRCKEHEGNAEIKDLHINLPFEGDLYESGTYWEELFKDVVDPDSLDETRIWDSKFKGKGAVALAVAPPRVIVVPERDPKLRNSRAANIESKYNANLSPSWDRNFRGNDLRELGPGVVSLEGIEFDVRGVIQLASGTNFNRDFTDHCTGIPVDASCSKLYFLHGCSYGNKDFLGKKVAMFVAHLEGGKEVRKQEIIYGHQVLDWWGTPTAEFEKPGNDTKVAWKGKNEAHSPIYLYLTTLDLGTQTRVRAVDFISVSKQPAPFLLAISYAE